MLPVPGVYTRAPFLGGLLGTGDCTLDVPHATCDLPIVAAPDALLGKGDSFHDSSDDTSDCTDVSFQDALPPSGDYRCAASQGFCEA
jgi:hypothetical protein